MEKSFIFPAKKKEQMKTERSDAPYQFEPVWRLKTYRIEAKRDLAIKNSTHSKKENLFIKFISL